jgi:hypothetical protein
MRHWIVPWRRESTYGWEEDLAAVALEGPEALEAYADSRFPLRVIQGELGPYLLRWEVETSSAGHLYLHSFVTSDPGVDLHTHPWEARGVILIGGYTEERLEDGVIVRRERRVGDRLEILEDTVHRVDLPEPATCWTLFETGPYLERSWSFIDRVSHARTPWRDALRARGLPVTR